MDLNYSAAAYSYIPHAIIII